jgi:exopolysaccharide biosynthesis polyprenyl glycosylphosphotransferase
LAQRRLLASIVRHALRIATLHVFDAVAIAASSIALIRIAQLGDGRRLWPALVGLVLVGLNANGAYKAGEARRDPRRLSLGVLLAVVALAVVSAIPPGIDIPLVFLPGFFVAVLAALAAERWLLDAGVKQAYAHGIGLKRAIVIGRRADADEVITSLQNDEHRDHHIIGYVTPTYVHDAQAIGTIDHLDVILDREDPAELIIAGSPSPDVVRRVADACVKHGMAMIAVPTWSRGVRGWAEPVKVGGLSAYQVHPLRPGLPSLMLKRGADLVFTSIGLVFCAPLMALVALAIKLDSPGPVFFRQRRVGLGGREFRMWKFRSMSLQAEEQCDEIAHLNPYSDGRLFKLRDDPRVTRVGKALRRFSLDELPQLFNVMAGDMSLVGPRPPIPAEVARYDTRHFVRLSVVPGLTGPWQVGGRNLITDFEEVVRLERAYINEWSFALDLKIMAKTVGVVLSGEGAY